MVKRKWEDHEEKFILDNYKTMTTKEIAKSLGRTELSVSNKIYKIISPSDKKNKWEESDVQYILDNYNNMTCAELGRNINKSESNVTKKLQSLGIYKSNKVFWSEEDDKFLEDNWGYKSCKAIAKHLNRSENSVKRRGYNKGLGGLYKDNFLYSIAELRDIFNVNRSVIENWINKKGLKAVERTFAKKKGVFVNPKDLYSFLKNNQHLWNAAKADVLALGIDEDWIHEKLKNDKRDEIKMRSKSSWTTKEEYKLIDMSLNGFTILQIASELKRSKDAIECKRRILKRDNRLTING